MARKKNNQPLIDVTGLTINDIINIDYNDINRMSKENIKRIGNRLVSATNKRIRRLEASNVVDYSRAYQQISKRGGQFSIKGKDRNQTLETIGEMLHFLRGKTSSVQGAKKFRKDTLERLGVTQKDIKSGKFNEREFWQTYRKLVDETGGDDAMKNVYGSDVVQLKLRDEMLSKRHKNQDEVFNKMRELLEDAYKPRAFDDVPELFIRRKNV